MLGLVRKAAQPIALTVLLLGLHSPAFAQEKTPASDTAVRFPAGHTSVDIPFEILANVPYVSVRINDRGPYLFGVDTGAGGVALASELQDAFGISISGNGVGSGAGSGGYVTGIVSGPVTLTFPGGLTVTSEAARTLALSNGWALLGRKVYGFIGYDVLRHFVVTFDYENKVLSLSDPNNSKQEVAGGLAFRQVNNNRSPQIDGEISVPGRPAIPVPLNIDTGAGGLIISGPVVKANNLVESVSAKLPSHSTGAGNGESRDWVARIEDIRIGGVSVPQPVVALSQDTQGALTRSAFVNLGGNLLRRFKLTIDYPRMLVFVTPNSHLRDPFPADASGMVFRATPDDFHKFTVLDVVPGSPAAEAGVQPGDILTELDGKPLDRTTQIELMEIFRQPGRHRIGFSRQGEKHSGKLALRKLL